MKTEKIVCDKCGKDLTYANEGFRFCLRVERIPCSPTYFDRLNETVAFKQEKHYCHTDCIISHLEAHRLKDNETKE